MTEHNPGAKTDGHAAIDPETPKATADSTGGAEVETLEKEVNEAINYFGRHGNAMSKLGKHKPIGE